MLAMIRDSSLLRKVVLCTVSCIKQQEVAIAIDHTPTFDHTHVLPSRPPKYTNPSNLSLGPLNAMIIA